MLESGTERLKKSWTISDPDECKSVKKRERLNAAKVLCHFAKRVAKLGFHRLSTFFSRESGEVIQFLHLHKYTFGPFFRMHICIRVLNEAKVPCNLSGTSDQALAEQPPKFEYGTDVATVQGCADMMADFVESHAEPWFKTWSNEALLSEASFLRPAVRASLAAHIAGQADEANILASRALFIK